VEVGVNVLVKPEPEGNHVYVVAPVTVATTAVPLQIVVLVIEAITVGVAVIVIDLVAVVVPEALATVKVIVFTPAAV
jgi:hypothetical protein